MKMVSFCIITLIFALFMCVRRKFFGIFTSDAEVLHHAMEVSTVVGLGLFPDYWQSMVNGCIRALGIQNKAIKFNVIAYWFLNTGLIWLLAFQL